MVDCKVEDIKLCLTISLMNWLISHLNKFYDKLTHTTLTTDYVIVYNVEWKPKDTNVNCMTLD